MYKFESISRYILNMVETCHHLISIRLFFILTILITEDDHNHILLTIGWFSKKWRLCVTLRVKFQIGQIDIILVVK